MWLSRLIRSRRREAEVPPRDYLEQQVARSWDQELRNLQSLGLRDATSIADLGCGPGNFTRRLADAFPRASITAIDADPRMLALARERLPERVTIIEKSADTTELPDAAFDFAIARLLFQHLRDPLAVAREARRILKPGGVFAIIDIDDDLFGVVDPPIPALPRLLAKYAKLQAKRGGNRHVARALPRILRDAGFTGARLECIAIDSDEAGLEATLPQLDPAPLRALRAAGELSRLEYASLRAAHEEFLASEHPHAVVLLFMACGVVSAPPSAEAASIASPATD